MNYTYEQAMGDYRGMELTSAGVKSGQTGHNHQCTNVAKSFARMQYGLNLGGTGNGKAYGDPNNNSSVFKNNYSVFQNNGAVMPQENDFISWTDGGDTGHVGLIAEVVFDDKSGSGYVYTLEQNVPGRGLYPQPINRSYDSEGQATYNVGSRIPNYSVQGWARNKNEKQLPYTSIQHSPATKSAKLNQKK